jgi:hypothetical protein
MSTKSANICRHHRLRDAYRKKIGQLGVFIEGTLSGVRRPGRRHLTWQLTFKQHGKTRTVYVPAELVPEVKLWAREYKRLKVLVRKVTSQSLAIVRRHGAVRRAESRGRHRTARCSGGASSTLSGTVSRT